MGLKRTTLLLALALPSQVCRAQEAKPQATSQPWEAPPRPHLTELVPTLLIRPISTHELERYAAMLSLSDAQRAFLNSEYLQYCSKCASLWSKTAPQLQQLGDDASNGNWIDQATVDLHLAFLKMQESLSSDIKSQDADFFGRLETILADPQLEKMQRVRMHRQRTIAHAIERPIAVSRLDLSMLVEDSGLDSDGLVAVDPVMAEYEAVVTPLMVRFDQGLADRLAKRMRIIRERLLHQASREAVAALDDEHERIFTAAAEIDRKIAKVDREFFPRFLEALPTGAKDGFRHVYQNEAYRLVYPDWTDPGDLKTATLAVCNTPEVRPIVTAIWDTFDQKHQAICQAMEAEVDQWGYKSAITRATLSFPDFQQRIRKLRAERMEIDKQVLTDLQQALGAVSSPEVEALIGQIRSKAGEVQVKIETAKTDDFPLW